MALLCWIFATAFIELAVAGLMVVVLMLLSGMLDWSDITGNKPAWNTFVWFATLVTMAAGLSDVGFIAWLGKLGAQMLGGIPPVQATMALLPAVLAIGVAIPGINVMVFCLLLVTSLGVMGIITPYGTGPSPLYYGSGYLPTADYWRLGILFGAIFLVLLLVIGYHWMLMVV